ncbi:MAG: nucleotidyltransferase domain-containing protein [Candidatus Omnitrophota bacterium]
MTPIKIDNQIFEKLNVKLVYLFGSRAKGNFVKESDFDIAVLFKKKPSDPLALKEVSILSHKLSKFFPAKIDIVSLNQSSSLLKYEAIASGRPLYCSSESERINFEVSVLKEYIDEQFMRDIYFKAMKKRVNKGAFS